MCALRRAAISAPQYWGTFMRVRMCLFMLWCLASHPALAQDRDYGRSMVVTDRGIVATSQVLASQAGTHILEQGGSAIDAAIAANAVLGVTEPMMNGIGGNLFLLYWDAKSGKLYGLNASGWAPQGLTTDFLKKQGITSMPDNGIRSVTVPDVGWLGEGSSAFWKIALESLVYTCDLLC